MRGTPSWGRGAQAVVGSWWRRSTRSRRGRRWEERSWRWGHRMWPCAPDLKVCLHLFVPSRVTLFSLLFLLTPNTPFWLDARHGVRVTSVTVFIVVLVWGAIAHYSAIAQVPVRVTVVIRGRRLIGTVEGTRCVPNFDGTLASLFLQSGGWRWGRIVSWFRLDHDDVGRRRHGGLVSIRYLYRVVVIVVGRVFILHHEVELGGETIGLGDWTGGYQLFRSETTTKRMI